MRATTHERDACLHETPNSDDCGRTVDVCWSMPRLTATGASPRNALHITFESRPTMLQSSNPKRPANPKPTRIPREHCRRVPRRRSQAVSVNVVERLNDPRGAEASARIRKKTKNKSTFVRVRKVLFQASPMGASGRRCVVSSTAYPFVHLPRSHDGGRG